MTRQHPQEVPRTSVARIWSVVRMHLVDRRTYIGIPWLIVAFAFAVSIIISNIIGFATGEGLSGVAATEGQRYSWAVLAPQWYLIVVAVQSIAFGFPFALGFSVTRREFYLGTSLLFVLISAFNAAAFTLLTQIERLTHGWGLGTYMFNALWFGQGAWYVDLLSFFVTQLLVFFIGASIATVYMRWRMPGMLIFWISLALLLLGTVALITYTSSWPAVITWFSAQGTAGIFAWLLIPAVVAAAGGFLALRRATPKN
ncbi:hypothetical protein [Glaciibacter psychrotolerans]|uniref:Uncharacterized protein n=1 Tax=Glaciibacter psychrotolerans TaxID=670054 RepID=A0A7Z0J5J5_9MICO|nr:hypothetical protein [Leifsonia psychrotolerans]NYJ19460.1 hypothetical protein [Leifsonia psychrotolerans]